MNGNEKRKYLRESQRVNSRFERKYSPIIQNALDKTVSSLIGTVKERGLRTAINDLQMTLINEHLASPLMMLLREVGLYHAKVNYRFIRAEIAQKRFGVNEMWLQDIMNILRDTLLRLSIIKVTETLRNHLLLMFENAIRDGLSEDEFIELIKGDTFTRSQAQRIVRTETNRATNAGRKVVADFFEYEMVKEWVSFQDFRTRGRNPKDKKDHYHMNRQTVNLEDKFKDPKTGETIDFPSAPGASAAMVINCRCQMVTVPKRDENGRLIKKPTAMRMQGVPLG